VSEALLPSAFGCPITSACLKSTRSTGSEEKLPASLGPSDAASAEPAFSYGLFGKPEGRYSTGMFALCWWSSALGPWSAAVRVGPPPGKVVLLSPLQLLPWLQWLKHIEIS